MNPINDSKKSKLITIQKNSLYLKFELITPQVKK
jgi:hypothetical protein